MTRRPLNLLGLAVLSYLREQPMHAYELHRRLVENDAAHTFRLSYGALYSVVRQLEKAGHIARSGVGRTGKLPEHVRYEVTDAGREETHRWLSRIIAEPQHEYPTFAAALSLIVVLPPDEVLPLLVERRDRVKAEVTSIAALRTDTIEKGVHPVFLIEDEYREGQLTTEIGFIGELIDRIRRPEWSEAWRQYHAPGSGQTGEPT